MKAAIVLTTITVPELLIGYIDNLEKYGHNDVGIIVVGDRKTPKKANEKLAEKIRNRGFSAEYWDINRQKRWLAQWPKLSRIIPSTSPSLGWRRILVAV